MNARLPSRNPTTRQHQRGAAALLMILTLIVIMTIVLAPRLTLWQVHNAATGRGYQALIDAKAAILAHAASPDADSPSTGRLLGQITLTPDLPATAATTYTGLAGTTVGGKPGCATTTWLPGQSLTDPNIPAFPLIQHPNVRCFGRFPWLSYGLPGPSTSDDAQGEVPWMFVSANLVGVTCVNNLNPLMLTSAYTGGCNTAVPFPWLTVVDGRGNVLSAQVAIVLILPGPPVTAVQQRTTPNDRAPAAYLESLTVAAGCPAPCVPGIYNNANYTAAGGVWTFIDAPPSTALSPPPAYYQQPFTFNDRLIYITASEYFEAMETRARSYAQNALSQYKGIHGYLPYPGDQLPRLTTTCNSAVRFGLLPTNGCGGASAFLPAAWYANAGWGNYFVYAVDAGCVRSAAAPRCLAPTLQLGVAATRYNAVLLSPGRAITAVPYAVPKNAVQVPISPFGVLGSLADFLDSVKNVAGGPQFDAAGTLATANYNDRMYGIL